jgi:tetratricopeptide (TPR) repeat protein
LAWEAASGKTNVGELRAAFYDGKHGRLAIESFRQAQQLNPAFALTYESLYYYFDFGEQWEEARVAANALVKLMPRCARAFYMRGRCLAGLHHPAPALEDFQVSLKLNPNDAEVHFDTGNSYVDLEEYDKAVESYNAALRLKFPVRGLCHCAIGNAYEKARKYKQAICAFEEARALGISDEQCTSRIALCQRLMR